MKQAVDLLRTTQNHTESGIRKHPKTAGGTFKKNIRAKVNVQNPSCQVKITGYDVNSALSNMRIFSVFCVDLSHA